MEALNTARHCNFFVNLLLRQVLLLDKESDYFQVRMDIILKAMTIQMQCIIAGNFE